MAGQDCIKLGLANVTKVTDLDWRCALPVVLVVVLVLVLDFPPVSFEEEVEDEDEDD